MSGCEQWLTLLFWQKSKCEERTKESMNENIAKWNILYGWSTHVGHSRHPDMGVGYAIHARHSTTLIEMNKYEEKKMRKEEADCCKEEEKNCLISFGCFHVQVDAKYNGVMSRKLM